MRGMIYRRRARDLIATNRRPENAGAAEAEVLEVTEHALGEFHRAQKLEDDADYGFVAAIQVAVSALEFGRIVSRAETFGEFLSQPRAAPYRQLLQAAVDALDRI